MRIVSLTLRICEQQPAPAPTRRMHAMPPGTPSPHPVDPEADQKAEAADQPPALATGDAEERLAAARAAIEAGDLPRAEALYADLLAVGCRDVRLFSNLGALALKRDQAAVARDWLEQGLALDPCHAPSLLNLGMALHRLERTPEAIDVLRRAVQADPQQAKAWNNLAVALIASCGRAEEGSAQPQLSSAQEAKEREIIHEAIAAYRRALELQPGYADAAANLARLLADQGDPRAGELVLRNLPPEDAGAVERFYLGEMLRLQGQLQEALDLFAEALAHPSADADLRLTIGTTLVNAGQADQALSVLLPLIAERPQDAEPTVALGSALKSLGETDQAMDLYRRALELDPGQVRAYVLLGVCFYERGQHSLAIEQFRSGLEKAPADIRLRCNLAMAMRSQGDLEGSMREMEQLMQEQPHCREACNMQLFSCSIGSEQLAPLALEVGARYWELLRSQPQQRLAAGASSPLPQPPPSDGRLRIGFLSAEIGNHVVASFLEPFLLHYDRSRFSVELFAVARRFDTVAERLVAHADEHWLLSGMAMPQARALIRSRRLDVLVETSGFTRDSGIDLLAERCAPVQCHYIGFHATTALDTIDWFIGDAETVPEAFAPQFVERLWRLPRPWLACNPHPSLPPVASLAADERPVFGSFNQLAKVRQETLVYWLAALRAVPSSILMIKDNSTADATSCERILAFLTEGGVNRERITFLPSLADWHEHMNQYNKIDLALDATPWSSATTAFDVLQMGVPLVAIRGGCTSARMSSAILRGLGQPGWIAESPEQFAGVVQGFCSDLSALREGKQQRRDEMLACTLCGGDDLASALEAAFTAMVEQKEPPEEG